MLSLILCMAGVLPQGGGAPVVINEFSYLGGGGGTDFVELYNRSGSDVDISNWTLTNNRSGGMKTPLKIPANTILLKDDYYVIGKATVPEVDLTPPGGPNYFYDNDGGIILKDDTGATIDTVTYETNVGLWASAEAEGQGLWGRSSTNSSFPSTWHRAVDGLDTDNNGHDFVILPWTPGMTNDPPGTFPYAQDFDDEPAEVALATEWGRTIGFAHTIDPTIVSQHNPSMIPASPQGGHCMCIWPDSGANPGNLVMLLTSVPSDVVFEAWVYFDAVIQETGKYEVWSVGFGTSDSPFQPPDPQGRYNNDKNGNTGVAWTFQVTDRAAELYLMDHNDGGWGSKAVTPPTVIGMITITDGQNDGWQRLRLERNGDTVVGTFGGTLGCADGTTFSATVANTNVTTLYAGFRETVENNSEVRPFTMDDVLLRAPTSAVQEFGTAVPTNSGTPTIAAIGPATIGFEDWQLQLSGLVPSQNTVLLLGGAMQTPPLDLSLIGGQPGSNLYVVPAVILSLASDASGDATLPVPIPCEVSLLNKSVFWQNLDPDATLSVTLPLGNSAGLETKFGT